MSEVNRYKVVTMLSEEGNKISYKPHGPDVVTARDFDAAQSELAALREELATAKRNEHNSEVAYRAAIEKQDELRWDRRRKSSWRFGCCPVCRGSGLIASPLPERSLEAAAKTLAACLDYPWEHMPEQGRASLREHAKAVINAATKELTQ